MNNFLYWAGLTSQEHLLLDPYLNKSGEYSIFKGVPIQHLTQVQAILKRIKLANRVKFRGPRRPGLIGRATCLKQDAKTFAVYPR